MEPIPELDRKGLREFGLVTGGLIAALFGLAIPWLAGFRYPQWPWIVGGILAAWALAAPQSLRPVYRIWMRFGHAMGRVTTPLIMGIVFFLVITPVSCVMRVMRRDPMRRKFDPGARSYRVLREVPRKSNMERPF